MLKYVGRKFLRAFYKKKTFIYLFAPKLAKSDEKRKFSLLVESERDL